MAATLTQELEARTQDLSAPLVGDELRRSVLGFCFPEGTKAKVPSAALLDIYAEFGPMGPSGELRAGRKGGRAMEPHEVRQMAEDTCSRQMRTAFPGRSDHTDLIRQWLGENGPQAYGEDDVFNLIARCDDFGSLQKAVGKDKRRRASALVHCTKRGMPLKVKKPQPVTPTYGELLAAHSGRVSELKVDPPPKPAPTSPTSRKRPPLYAVVESPQRGQAGLQANLTLCRDIEVLEPTVRQKSESPPKPRRRESPPRKPSPLKPKPRRIRKVGWEESRDLQRVR